MMTVLRFRRASNAVNTSTISSKQATGLRHSVTSLIGRTFDLDLTSTAGMSRIDNSVRTAVNNNPYAVRFDALRYETTDATRIPQRMRDSTRSAYDVMFVLPFETAEC